MSAFSDFMANLERIRTNPMMADLPVVGGILRQANPTFAATPAPAGTSGLLAGGELLNQGLGKVAQGGDAFGGGVTALMMGVAKGARLKNDLRDPNYVMTPDDHNTVKAMAELEQGHLMRAQETFQTGPDTTTSYVAGAGRIVANPLNFLGGAGELLGGGKALATVAGEAPRVTQGIRGLTGLGQAMTATNELMGAPFALAGHGLGKLPTPVARVVGGAGIGAAAGGAYSSVSGDEQRWRDVLIGAALGAGSVSAGGAGFDAFMRQKALRAAPEAAQVAAAAEPAVAAAVQAAPVPPGATDLQALLDHPPVAPVPDVAAPVLPAAVALPLDVPTPPSTSAAAPVAAPTVPPPGRVIERLAAGEFGSVSEALKSLQTANFGSGAGTRGALRAIYGGESVPGSQLINHLNYLVSRVQSDGTLWAKLENLNPRLAQALNTTIMPSGPNDLQNALRAVSGRTLKLGKNTPDVLPINTERPLTVIAQDLLAATKIGDTNAMRNLTNEYRFAHSGDPAVPVGPVIAAPPPVAPTAPVAAEPPIAPVVTPPVAPVLTAGDALYQRATDLMAGGDPGFQQAYLPGATYFAKRLGVDKPTSEALFRRMVDDPAVVDQQFKDQLILAPASKSVAPMTDLNPVLSAPEPVAVAAPPPVTSEPVPPSPVVDVVVPKPPSVPPDAVPTQQYQFQEWMNQPPRPYPTRSNEPLTTTKPITDYIARLERDLSTTMGVSGRKEATVADKRNALERIKTLQAELTYARETAATGKQYQTTAGTVEELRPRAMESLRQYQDSVAAGTPDMEALREYNWVLRNAELALGAINPPHMPPAYRPSSTPLPPPKSAQIVMPPIVPDVPPVPVEDAATRLKRINEELFGPPAVDPATVARESRTPVITPVRDNVTKLGGTVSQFIETLYSTYKALVPEADLGIPIKLKDVYQSLKQQQGVPKTYSLADFTHDVSLIDRNPIEKTKSGAIVTLPASTSARGAAKDMLPFVAPDGYQAKYYGLNFREPPVVTPPVPDVVPAPSPAVATLPRGVRTQVTVQTGGGARQVAATVYGDMALSRGTEGRLIVTDVASGRQLNPLPLATREEAQAFMTGRLQQGAAPESDSAAWQPHQPPVKPTPSDPTMLGLNVGAGLKSPLTQRMAAGALAGGLSTATDPNATPQDVLMRGLVGAGVAGVAPLAWSSGSKLARVALPDAPATIQDLGAAIVNSAKGPGRFSSREAAEWMSALEGGWQNLKQNFWGKSIRPGKQLDATGKQWRSQITATPHNWLQDEATIRAKYAMFAKDDGASIADWDQARVDMLANRNAATAFEKLPNRTQEILTATGHADYNINESVGESLIGYADTHGTTAGPIQRGITGAAFSAYNPTAMVVPKAAVAYGAARGVLDPFVGTTFKIKNAYTNLGGRLGFWDPGSERRLAESTIPFLRKLEHQGIDTSTLAQKQGLFSAKDVEDLLVAHGTDATAAADTAAQWDTLSLAALDQAGERVRTVFGDMNAFGGAGRALSNVIPFASWPLSQAKITAEMIAKYPGPTATLVGAVQRNKQRLEREGKPGYLAAMIPIPTDMPLLGGLARARLNGREGQAYLNPLSVFMPGSDWMAVSGTTPQDTQKTPYQRAQDALGLPGLSFGPLPQAAAYATGLDYRRPGPLSRTAGLELAMPGPMMPALPVMALDAARKTIVPALAKASVPTGSSSIPVDAVQKEIALLTQERTGLVLGQPGTEQQLAQSFDKNSPLYQEALGRVQRQAAIGSAVSVTSPIAITGQTNAQSAGYQAKAGMPYDYNALKTMEQLATRPVTSTYTPEERQRLVQVAATTVSLPPGITMEQVPPRLLATSILGAMQQRNAEYTSQHPLALAPSAANPRTREDNMLAAWDRENFMLSIQAPRTYKQRRAEFKAQLAKTTP